MMVERGVLDEEITVYRQIDLVSSEAGGIWSRDCEVVAGAQREQCDPVSVASH